VILLEQITKRYRTKRGEVEALNGVDLEVAKGEFLVVVGPSGSGKTTLLLTIGAMLRPTAGRVLLDGRDTYALSERDRGRLRARSIGFVFQMFHLLPYLTVRENVLLSGTPGERQVREARAVALLDRLRLTERADHRPAELSAGEKQRTAIARALVNSPRVILADEPTGNLDPASAEDVVADLAGFHRDGGTVVLVTHGTVAAQHADRIIHLSNGRIV
jgi:putative ABC transport system ATP-binding protein